MAISDPLSPIFYRQQDTKEIKIDPLVERLNRQKQVAFNFQKRKHNHWKENYLLYRDFVETNRLTQRQPVNIPIMKETMKTWLSKIDETPDIVFEILGMGKSKRIDREKMVKEAIINELWRYYFDKNQLEILDKVDKKIVFLQGRSFKKLNFINNDFVCDIIDPYDILVDPLTIPYDLETARYIIHIHIFKTLREILANKNYDEKAKKELVRLISQGDKVIEQKRVHEALEHQRERLSALGYSSFHEISAGDTIIELNEYYTKLFDEKEKRWVKYLIVTAMDSVILLKKPLKEVLGVEFYPFVTWSDDVDLNDFWSDSLADLIRTPNKILNIWFSQLLENRTYRNFGMMFYNSSLITPPTFEPKPFGMYGIPVPEGRSLSEMFQYIQIPPLTDTINEMEYVTKFIERASGVVALDKGVSEKKQITLGEVQILASKSAERAIEIAKNYRRAWKEFAMKWYEIMKENKTDAVKLFKRNYKGRWWEKVVYPSDWIDENGYQIIVRSSSEQENDRLASLQKLMFAKEQFVDNKSFNEAFRKRVLEICNFSSEEINNILEEERQKEKENEKKIGNILVNPETLSLASQTLPDEYDLILQKQKKALKKANILEEI